MSNETEELPLPFNLTPESLAEVELLYGLYSSKTGAGVEEASLHGTGRVVLRRTASYNSPPEILEGRVAVAVVVRLLELLEDQRFTGLDDLYPSDHPGLRRVVKLTSPTVAKTVAVDAPGDLQFERIVSALIFAASLGQPALMSRRFFQLMGPI